MTAPEGDVTAAWHELLDGLRTVDARFLDGPRAVGGPRGAADGYRMALTALGVPSTRTCSPTRAGRCSSTWPAPPGAAAGGEATTPTAGTASRRSTPGGRTASAVGAATARTSASPSTTSRARGVVEPHRGERQRHRPRRRRRRPLLLRDRPDRARRPRRPLRAARRRRRHRVHPRLPGRPPPRPAGDLGDRGARRPGLFDPPDRTDEGTALALRAALRWVRTLFDIVPMELAPKHPDRRDNAARGQQTGRRATGGRRSTPPRRPSPSQPESGARHPSAAVETPFMATESLLNPAVPTAPSRS